MLAYYSNEMFLYYYYIVHCYSIQISYYVTSTCYYVTYSNLLLCYFNMLLYYFNMLLYHLLQPVTAVILTIAVPYLCYDELE